LGHVIHCHKKNILVIQIKKETFPIVLETFRVQLFVL
jgi:hypothetical protein